MHKRTILIGLIAVAVLAVVGVVLVLQFGKPEQASTRAYWPTQDWKISTPEEQGLDSVKLAELLKMIQDGNILIDSLLVIRNGSIVLDAYFNDPYDGTFPHDMASVTKSVMTTLIGIAADQGRINLDQPVVSFFPDRTVANLDERKEGMTVRHLASMANGFQSGCMSDDQGTIERMMSNSDWVQSALDRKMAAEPGTIFCYDSPGMHLLSAILQEATGMTALEFAQKNLFKPLGIREEVWESDPQGYTRGWGDLHLKPRDAAKIGYLWLNKGVWDDKQIVSSDWVEEAVKPHSQTGNYGYGWWISEDGYSASGRAGQSINIAPALNAIVVTTGSGFSFDEISYYLQEAVIDPDNPLPANPEGVAQLEAALASLEQAPTPFPAEPLPEIAKAISGKTYVFEPNSASIKSLDLEFNDSAQAMVHILVENSDNIQDWPIGLNGEYRVAPNGYALRGYWQDSQTFILEIFDIGQMTYQLHFEDDRLLLEAPLYGIKAEGQVEN